MNYLQMLANTILPELVKITVSCVLIPMVAVVARHFTQIMAQYHLSILVKWAGQTISRDEENWAEARLAAVVAKAQGIWWLKWMNEADLKTYIEAAVAEWNADVAMNLSARSQCSNCHK